MEISVIWRFRNSTDLCLLTGGVYDLSSEYHEQLLSPKSGSIYEAYQKLGEKTLIAKTIANDIELTILYEGKNDNLINLIERANELCAELNLWLLQFITQVSYTQIE